MQVKISPGGNFFRQACLSATAAATIGDKKRAAADTSSAPEMPMKWALSDHRATVDSAPKQSYTHQRCHIS
jgi:hypothetical protein